MSMKIRYALENMLLKGTDVGVNYKELYMKLCIMTVENQNQGYHVER